MILNVDIAQVDEMLSLKCSINFYMFTGGTNFGFSNGANYFTSYNIGYHGTVTSYDYDGLISESGDCHATKYAALRTLLVKHDLVRSDTLPPIPSNHSRVAYASAQVTEFQPLDAISGILSKKSSIHPEPLLMEFLNVNDNNGQSYGWILYRFVWSSPSSSSTSVKLILEGTLNDRGLVYVNRRRL